MANPWEMNWGGDPVIAPPDPYKQRADVRAERTADRGDAQFQYQVSRDRQEDALRAKEDMDKAAQAEESRRDAASALRRTIEKIDAIKGDATDSWTGIDGLGETGMLGAMQGGVPGSPAYSLRKDIGTIDSTQVLQAMTRLKELSPTGSTGFGALSAPELELLKSSVARLDPNMDQETFMANLNAAKKVYANMLLRIEGKSAEQVLSEALQGGASRDELLEMASLYDLEMNAADLDANLRSRSAGGPVNKVLPPDIEAIMQKYGAQ
jgi:hypothetical protein